MGYAGIDRNDLPRFPFLFFCQLQVLFKFIVLVRSGSLSGSRMQPWFCPLATNTKRHLSDVCCKTKSVFVLLLMASISSSQRWSHPLPIKHCTMTQRSDQQSPRAPHYYSISLTFCYGPRCCQLLHPSCSPPSEAARISHLRYLRGSGEPHCSKVPSLWWMCEWLSRLSPYSYLTPSSPCS